MSTETHPSGSVSCEQHQDPTTEDLVDAVSEDKKLGPSEKETLFRLAKDQDQITVFTEEGGLMRRLIQHTDFRLEKIRINRGDSYGKYVAPDDFEGGSITAIEGNIPIAFLCLQTSSRETSQHAGVVPDRVLK